MDFTVRFFPVVRPALASLTALGLLALVACAGGPPDIEDEVARAAPAAEATPAPGPEGDALVPGTEFHATGAVPCTMTDDGSTDQCPFGVTREGNGGGMVTVTKPDGRTRVIFFADGKAIGYDENEADPGEFSTSREGDNTIVRIGTERYEIPDAVVMGG